MTIVMGERIDIKGPMPRHEIVRKVINTFIETEYLEKGGGTLFRYPVETLPGGQLFIARPGHKKNFDFKVEMEEGSVIGERGTHDEIAKDIRDKKKENEDKFSDLFKLITEMYKCSENDIDMLLANNEDLIKSFKTGASIEFLLKVLKWLFIMEDIIYWDNEGRSFLFNYLKYAAEENDDERFKTLPDRAKRYPHSLRRHMKKCNIEWLPYM